MTEFITRNYGQKEFEVIIKTDNKDHYKATEDFARNLIDHAKPQTNADRIRAMSDEELADWIARTQIANVAEALSIAGIPYEQTDGIEAETKKGCLEWLKQPVEEQ